MKSKSNKLNWAKLRDPDYRNAFVSSTVAARIAVRIYNLRKKMPWTQEELASRAGMKQARISVLEQADYENFSFNTLKRIAAAFNVAVIIDFVSFPDFLKWSNGLNSESAAPESFEESTRAQEAKEIMSSLGWEPTPAAGVLRSRLHPIESFHAEGTVPSRQGSSFPAQTTSGLNKTVSEIIALGRQDVPGLPKLAEYPQAEERPA